jgi:hypothetical protein
MGTKVIVLWKVTSWLRTRVGVLMGISLVVAKSARDTEQSKLKFGIQ